MLQKHISLFCRPTTYFGSCQNVEEEIYRNNLKNREFAPADTREDPRDLRSENQIAQIFASGANGMTREKEDLKLAASSDCFDIDVDELDFTNPWRSSQETELLFSLRQQTGIFIHWHDES